MDLGPFAAKRVVKEVCVQMVNINWQNSNSFDFPYIRGRGATGGAQ